MTAKASFEYCMTCFRNTYKYFGILRTKAGPIFDTISPDVPETSLLYAERVSPEKMVQDATNNHRNFIKNDTPILTVSQVEEELKRTSLGASKRRANRVSVSIQKAQEMYSCFNITSLHYEFHGENFIGNQVFITYIMSEVCVELLIHQHGSAKMIHVAFDCYISILIYTIHLAVSLNSLICK
jgi:hypothetical protein